MCGRDVRDVTAVLRVLLFTAVLLGASGLAWLWLAVYALVGPAVRSVASGSADASEAGGVAESMRRHPSRWEAPDAR